METATAMTAPPILNISDIPLTPYEHGERFAAKSGRFGPLIGMQQLGCSLVVVPPGKRSSPFHAHHVNEEMFVILDGTGTLRLGDAEHAVKAGDVIACPAGGPETAHHLVNTGEAELRYLAISTMKTPEVCEYPDSGKFLAIGATTLKDGDGAAKRFGYVGRLESSLDYWDGE
jgi:uncharacterized cupin superfamily protein